MPAVSRNTQDRVIFAVAQATGRPTAKELGVSPAVMRALVAEQLVKVAAVRKNVDESGKVLRGRPAFEYALDRRGRDRARRAARKHAVAA
jgi:predicted ArsR family transcriptional regulator